MKFRSTLSHDPQVSFKEAVLRCLPPDGGLYVPFKVMDMRQYFFDMNENTAYPELVTAVTRALLHGELNHFSAARVAESAFDFEPELIQLDENFSILNLYNGPSGTFKDFGVAFLAAVLEELLKNDPRALVLSAVRGDGGFNMAKAFYGRNELTSVLLYPDGPICGLNSAFFVPNGGNIIPIQVKGTLDNCQQLITEAITGKSFAKQYKITSANAINLGRLLPQAFYFLFAYIKIKSRLSGDLFFSVPSGNFGNLISGLYAWKFGLPANGFIAAMNINNTFGDFIRGKKFEARPVVTTNSPALDVSIPSNYARLNCFYDEAPDVMRKMVFPASIDDAVTLKTMEYVWKQYGILLDPHGAVAFAAAQDFINSQGSQKQAHVIVLATGHPAREAGTVETATGQKAVLSDKLALLKKESEPVVTIEPNLSALDKTLAAYF